MTTQAVDPDRHDLGVPGLAPGRLLRARALVVRHPIAATFVVAVGVRAVAAVLIFVRYGGSLFADEETYSSLAAEMAEGNTELWPPYAHWLYGATRTFLLPLTAIYRVTGEITLLGQLLVALLGALAAAGTTAVARRLLPTPWALGAGLVVALLPSQILWSSITLKDAFVWACVVAIAVAVSRSKDLIAWQHVAAVVVVLGLLAYLRPHTLIIASWGVVIAVALVPRRGRLAATAALAVAALLIPAAIDLGPGGWTFARNSGSLEARRALNAIGAETALVSPIIAAETAAEEAAVAEAEASAARAAAADAEAAAESNDALRQTARQLHAEAEEKMRIATALRERADRAAAASSPLVADSFGDPGEPLPDGFGATVRYLPTGIEVMLLRPYPWSSSSNRNLQLARLESFLWYPLLLLAVAGLALAWRRRDVLGFPLLVGAGSMLVSAVSQGNFGTAYRHRGEFVWVVALLAAAGAWWLVERRRARQPSR